MAKARIAVIGAGLMGHGIAQVFALAGHDVTLTDAHAPTLATAKIASSRICAISATMRPRVARVRIVPALAESVREADFVVEAVLEDLRSSRSSSRRSKRRRAPTRSSPATPR